MGLRDLKIGVRISLFTSLAIGLILTSLGVYIYSSQTENLLSTTDANMASDVDDLKNFVELQISERQNRIEVFIDIASEIFEAKGKVNVRDKWIDIDAVNQETREVRPTKIPLLSIGGEELYKSTSLVDKIADLTQTQATIFQKTDDGFVRVSTTIRNDKGARAINTFIPYTSQVASQVEKGEDYFGRALVLDEWYLTAYRPLFYEQEVIGILFVGIPEKNMASIKKLFSEKRYFETGYPFIVDKSGELIVHSTHEGTSIAQEKFFKDILEFGSVNGKTDYEWEGEDKIQYFTYLPEMESYIVVSIYKEEMMVMMVKLRGVLIVAILFNLLVVILLSYLLGRSLSANIQKAVDFAEKIAEGDLTAELDIRQKDEVGVLSNALTLMVAKLRDIVSSISTGAVEIAAASQQISDGSQVLSQGANAQAAAAEEVASSMEEMAANIVQNSHNAIETERMSLQAKQSMGLMEVSGRKSFDSIQNIAGKISIINDIAFQTNILALNASVEAARAGEHGRGFAVVAAEVRKLAEHSKIAADEIALISKESLSVTKETESVIISLTPEITRTAELVQEIAASSGEQSDGVNQVNNALNDLNNIIQQNAASSEELATSSEELAGQADQLKLMISYFKTKETEELDS